MRGIGWRGVRRKGVGGVEVRDVWPGGGKVRLVFRERDV